MAKDEKGNKSSDKIKLEFTINNKPVVINGEVNYKWDKDDKLILSFDIKNAGKLDKVKLSFEEINYIKPV